LKVNYKKKFQRQKKIIPVKYFFVLVLILDSLQAGI